MNRRQILILAAVVLVAIAAYVGFRQLEAKNNRAKIVGTWAWELTSDDIYEGIVEANAIRGGASHDEHDHEGHDHDDHGHDDPVADAAEERSPEELALGEALSAALSSPVSDDGPGQLLPTIRFEQIFYEDGRYTLIGGVEPFHGTWSMPDANGSVLTAVVRLEQTPEITQRLVMWIRFIDQDTIEVADEVGTRKTFHRVPSRP